MKGMRIKRFLAGLSQAEIGKRLGRSPAWVSLVERGYLVPSDELMEAMEEQLKVTFDLNEMEREANRG